MKTIVCSDLHIGYEKSNYVKMKEFFEIAESEADMVIFNGDIFDCWRMPWKQIVSEHSDEIRSIEKLCKNVDVVYVLGNHDFSMKRKMLHNIRFFRNSFEFEGYHVEHGHRFDVIHRRFGSIINFIIWIYPPLYQTFLKSPSEINVTEYSHKLPMHTEAIKFANTIGKCVIVGHSHNPNMFENLVDCGDMTSHCTYVLIENGEHSIEWIR